MAAHMTKHRSAAGLTVFDGQIYALGGHDGLSIFDSVCFPLYLNRIISLVRFNSL